jgi:hypothetical protein
VGWGGASGDLGLSCPVAEAEGAGSTLKLQGCTVQLHPDSSHPSPVVVLHASRHASLTASGCKLAGPAQGKSMMKDIALAAGKYGDVSLVSAAERAMPMQICSSLIRQCGHIADTRALQSQSLLTMPTFVQHWPSRP